MAVITVIIVTLIMVVVGMVVIMGFIVVAVADAFHKCLLRVHL